MFQILKAEKTINFMRWSKVTFFISMLAIVASFASLAINKLNWGLDFTGGTLIELKFEEPAQLDVIRDALGNEGFADAVVQNFGSSRDVMIRMRPRENVEASELGAQVIQIVEGVTASVVDSETQAEKAGVQVSRVEFLGAAIGDELAEAGGLAILASLVCILIYISLRFEWRLASGAVASLAHDIIITIGIFSALQIEVDLTIIAALLTVVGYSLNDTVVVFDRIRENFRKMHREETDEVINASITQTLSRTLITSGTTLFVVVALFVLGGANIHGFATALLIGITVGTYSSIYVASALAMKLGINREHLMPPKVEMDEEFEQMP
uniref:protein translocase subunit SecF n=1 Tax=Thaumasiovibrio occultus TaxID=1891184 RepID=UPI000B35E295|nr:protein translocase subunit SecF [Thaumasiovibrio occultus]